jgi:predicted enzyme related to lactoylglutathione lyase
MYFHDVFSVGVGGASVNAAADTAPHCPAGRRPHHTMWLGRIATRMANSFGSDILIQAPDPQKAASFYVEQLGFTITGEMPHMINLHGSHINLFIERGPALGPVLEVTVDNVEEAKQRLVENGCEIVKDEPDFPRCYVKDPFGLIYNLTAS